MSKVVSFLFILIILGVIIFLRYYVLEKLRNSAGGLLFHHVDSTPTMFPKVRTLPFIDISWATSMAQISPNEVLVSSRDGPLVLVNLREKSSRTVFDMSKISGFKQTFESGFLCVCALPRNRSVLYVTYTIENEIIEEGVTLIVQECSFEDRSFKLGEELIRLDFPSDIHHAGTLAFDSNDNLYLSTGDGGPQGDPGNYAQNLKSYRGKILRLKGQDPEIVAYGLRNPWKISIDKEDRMFVADVGYNNVESLYLLPNLFPEKPYNCGWNFYEGSMPYRESVIPFSETQPPIFEYADDTTNDLTPGRGIIGGFSLNRDGRNIFVIGDYVSQMIFILEEKSIEPPIWSQVGKVKNSTTGDDGGGNVNSLGLVFSDPSGIFEENFEDSSEVSEKVWILGKEGVTELEI